MTSFNPTDNSAREALFSALKSCTIDTARLGDETDLYLHPLMRCLNEHGLKMGGASLVLKTRHPQVEMMVQRWRPKRLDEVEVGALDTIVGHYANVDQQGTIEVYLLKHGHSDQELYQKSPFARVEEHQTLHSWRLSEHIDPPRFPIFKDLVARGETEYMVLPIPMPQPYQLMMSLSTFAAEGFPPYLSQVMREIAPYLRLSMAHKIERIMMTELLAAYLGRKQAQQVASGRIRQGDLESINAVVGFIDLRGFTSLTERLDGEALVATMSSFYSAIDRSVAKHGGEILKFIGDGLLFMFAGDDAQLNPCQNAVDAMLELDQRIRASNAREGSVPIRYAAALHQGWVRYGNIGAPNRLDFTVIGSTVNRTVRLQELGADHDLTLVISPQISQQISQANSSLGTYEISGFNDQFSVHVLE
jgi:adenylate cyclase